MKKVMIVDHVQKTSKEILLCLSGKLEYPLKHMDKLIINNQVVKVWQFERFRNDDDKYAADAGEELGVVIMMENKIAITKGDIVYLGTNTVSYKLRKQVKKMQEPMPLLNFE